MSSVRFLMIFCLFPYHVNAKSRKTYLEFPWTSINRALSALCPSVDICGRRLDGTMDPDLSCCSECSCDANCKITGACCLLDTSFQEYGECVYPRTKYHNITLYPQEEIQSYIIINEPPLTGCDIEHPSTCNGDDFTKLSPVSDDLTGRVYFDEDCAICHGVLDTKPWKPVFNCLHVIRVDRIDIAHEVHKYFHEPDQSHCYFSFIPYTQMGVGRGTCHITRSTEWILESSERLEVAKNLNMTIDEIKDLCYSNINIPFMSGDSGRGFINPFCYLYDGGRVVDVCRWGDRIFNSDHYGVLLDYGKVKRIQTMDKSKPKTAERICYPPAKNADVEQKELTCRQINCPTGHLQDEKGRCVLIMNNILGLRRKRLTLYVNIRLSQTKENNYREEDIKNITADDIRRALPWPETWTVAFVGFMPGNIFNQKITRSDIVVRIVLKNGSLEFSLEKMLTYLKIPVGLHIGGHLIQFSQSFYHQVVRKYKQVIKGSDLGLPDHVLNVFQPWIPIDTIPSDPIEGVVISKLYFCKQVELQLDEFKLFLRDHVLYFNISDTYLYDLEFKILMNYTGDITQARLCVDDAGFVPSPNSCNSIRSLNAFFLFSIFRIFINNMS